MTDSFDEPAGIAPRGTLIVAAGRGEKARAYGRLGRRLAADGYRVRVLDDVQADLATALATAGKLLVGDTLPGPKVLVGADTGALFALRLAAEGAPGVDALVLAGLPAAPGTPVIDLGGFDAELDARSACPAHRGVLSDGGVTPGDLFSAPISTGLIEYAGYAPSVPTLGLHGEDDRVSPLDQARGRYPGQLVTVAGGRHDVLNDVSHRSVAATVVLFLERLRLGAGLPEIVRVAA